MLEYYPGVVIYQHLKKPNKKRGRFTTKIKITTPPTETLIRNISNISDPLQIQIRDNVARL